MYSESVAIIFEAIKGDLAAVAFLLCEAAGALACIHILIN